MIENLVWDSSGQIQKGLSDKALKQVLTDSERFIWVNIHDEFRTSCALKGVNNDHRQLVRR